MRFFIATNVKNLNENKLILMTLIVDFIRRKCLIFIFLLLAVGLGCAKAKKKLALPTIFC